MPELMESVPMDPGDIAMGYLSPEDLADIGGFGAFLSPEGAAFRTQRRHGKTYGTRKPARKPRGKVQRRTHPRQ